MIIDLLLLNKYRMSFNKYFILFCANNKDYNGFKEYTEKCDHISGQDYQFLERFGFITVDKSAKIFDIDSITVTKKGKSLLGDAAAKMIVHESSKSKQLDLEWVSEWRELFPKGVYSGGYPVRANVNDITKKMDKFIRTHGYDKEVIIAATQKYINEKEMSNYSYMMRSIYFIEKDGSSTLADYCEMIQSGDDDRDITRGTKMA